MHNQGQQTKEIEQKHTHLETGEFPNHSHFINYAVHLRAAQYTV